MLEKTFYCTVDEIEVIMEYNSMEKSDENKLAPTHLFSCVNKKLDNESIFCKKIKKKCPIYYFVVDALKQQSVFSI
jgi:hypothetical protein